MLKELNIRNFALIESLRIELDEGLNALTGETGAGKSIIVDVLGYLLGEKAGAGVVRKGADRCEMMGSFDVGKNKPAIQFLESLSLENAEDDFLILRREIDSQGKSKSFINDRPVNLSTLARLGEFLVDIHGQHEHQRLLKTSEQRDFLDLYAGAWDVREEVRARYEEWKSWKEQKAASQMSEQERAQKIDLYRFQVTEIDDAKLQPNEEEELDRLLPQLKNAEKIQRQLDEIFDGLYEAEGSVTERLRKAKRSIEVLEGLGADVKDSTALLDEALIRVDEVLAKTDALKKNALSDPGKLDQVFSRQDLISKLKRKYGATVLEILEHGEKVRQDLQRLEGHGEALKDLDDKINKAHSGLLKACKTLSAARKKSGEKLSQAVGKELKDLGFLKSRFDIQLAKEADENGKDSPTATGLEKVEFIFSANPGEDPKPLKAVASGGELSRLMLAMKKILAQADRIPTLIFDEVDSGVGGSMGHVIGEKLKSLGKTHQVIAITHLPQIAAFARRHIAVRKEVVDKRTMTQVELLEKEKRVAEIARMLGGIHAQNESPTPASLKHAEELLELAE